MRKDVREARSEEIVIAMGWVGNIKKAFQREQTRLRKEGVEIRFKPVWQSIHDTIWLLKERNKEIKS